MDFSNVHTLIVEDQILIAMDLEDTLLAAGVSEITTSSSQSDALLQIGLKRPSIAILDVNLGDETSLPIADLLLSLDVPFIFVTGYGEGGTIPPRFSAIEVVSKPYDAALLLEKIASALQGG